MKIIIFFLSLLLFISCNLKEDESNSDELKDDIKEIKNEVVKLNNEINILKFKNARFKITELEDLNIFDPTKLKISVYSKRPPKNNDTFLVVPGAFTDPNNQIDGLFIQKGNVINASINKKLNGVFVISKNSLNIYNSNKINQKYIDEIMINRKSLFQQVLLVFDFKIIECNLFRNNLNLRRALVEINNHFYLVESNKKITILDFQKLLVTINVENAIYLDMGTYSEGWYRYSNKTIIIGETMTQTKRQSNWLAFELQ